MEPVVLPKAIAPVTRSDRVKRAQPREDSNEGSTFARYLRQKKEEPAGASSQAGEDVGEAPGPDVAETLTEPHGQPSPRRVDIRV
jgi:hypothetical protein